MFTITISSLLLASFIITYLTNPFARWSIIRLPFRARLQQDVLSVVDNNRRITVRNSTLWRWFAIYQTGLYILTTRYLHSPGSSSRTVNGIIKDIHTLRYDPSKLLLISGDHFNALFVRNLGIFYYPMLDTAIPGTTEDWHNRQTVYLQTVAYALGVFAKSPTPTTTIVSTGRYTATCVNFYAYPSDAVYGIIYALAALTRTEQARPYAYAGSHHALDTVTAAQTMLTTYRQTLIELYDNYRSHVFDATANLIRTDVHLSGAKDITRRESAFFDNVIFWKTTALYMELGLIPKDKPFLKRLKRTILDTFWLEKEGYFLEDLSGEGTQNKYYSSDWLIVLATGFLNPADPAEASYFTRSIEYIQKEKIDQPFAIKYQQSTRAHRQFFAVRMAVASYGGDSIWSFWGMEYIKTLLALYQHGHGDAYADQAAYHLGQYKSAMLRDRGFPEVYDADGKFLQTPFYKSIRQTGWVIGFEQAREMYRYITGKKI